MKKQLALPLAASLLWLLLAPACAFARTKGMDPGNQPCSRAVATAVVDYWRSHLTEGQLLHAENVQRTLCKVNPTNQAETIVAIGPDDERDENAWTELAIVNAATHQVIAAGDAQLASGGAEGVGIAPVRIDTARYNLANGVRAFGLVAQGGFVSNCGHGSVGPLLYLYVRDGERIRPVLKGMYLSMSTFIQRANDRCSAAVDPRTPSIVGSMVLSIAVAPTRSHGYHDLRITADCSREPALDVDRPSRTTATSYLLHYDGREYPASGPEIAAGCDDRWFSAAVVVKPIQGTPVIVKAQSETFLPSTPLRIVARETTRILAQDSSGKSWWLPRGAIAEPPAFKRVRAWHGPATFEDDTPDGDSGTTYRFRPDGSYTFDYESSSGASQHGSGQLWAYHSVIAAGSDAGPGGSYFWRQPDGSLCDADLDGCPQP